MAGQKILIIEDNVINRKIMRDLLRFHHYETFEAVNGLEGVKMAKELLPDLIMMDIQLPELDGYSSTKQIKAHARNPFINLFLHFKLESADGYSATKKIKAHAPTQKIPIIAVTSFAMRGEADRAKEAGCDAYITKPIDIRQVILKVKEFLPESNTPQ